MTDDDCPHGINAEWCAICRNSGNVFISAGGQTYQRTANCPGLRHGQMRVERSGGDPAPIVSVPLASDQVGIRSACSVCNPPVRQ